MRDSRRTRVVLGALVAVALLLITIDARDGTASPVRGLHAIGNAVFGTGEVLVGSVSRSVAGLFRNAGSGSGSHAKIAALEQEVLRLRAELSQTQLSESQYAQLSSLLALAGRGGYRIVAANVIAAGPAYEETVTIDAGSADGIKPGETVLNGSGLVGTVTSAGSHTATVLLDTDAASKVGVRVAGTGEYGMVTGSGQSRSGPSALSLQVFDANAVVRPGEQLVTLSVGGRYMPGVPVGVITRVLVSSNGLTKAALVRPFANDGALGVIGVVIAPPRHNPHDSVLPTPPPSPTPTPCATVTPGATPSPGVTPSLGATPSPGATARC